jgi:hypothetical protein
MAWHLRGYIGRLQFLAPRALDTLNWGETGEDVANEANEDALRVKCDSNVAGRQTTKPEGLATLTQHGSIATPISLCKT